MKRSKSVKLAVVALLAAAFLSGCGGEEETAYCVDENNRVTDNARCDRANNPGFFWFFGAPGLGAARSPGPGNASTPPTRRRSRSVAASARARTRRRRAADRAHDRRRRLLLRGRLKRDLRGRALTMERHDIEPRPGWPAIVEEQGLVYWKTPLPDGEEISYWHEGAHYSLTAEEVYEIEAVARLMLEMLVEAGDYVIEENRFAQMGIPGWAVPRIRQTWESEPPMLYGRFDFAYGHDSVPKLLEYNDADRAARVRRRAVVLGARRLRRRRRPVEHAARDARRALARACAGRAAARRAAAPAAHKRRAVRRGLHDDRLRDGDGAGEVLQGDAVSRGRPLVLRRDRGNAHDPNAVAVQTFAGARAGFVPRYSGGESHIHR